MGPPRIKSPLRRFTPAWTFTRVACDCLLPFVHPLLSQVLVLACPAGIRPPRPYGPPPGSSLDHDCHDHFHELKALLFRGVSSFNESFIDFPSRLFPWSLPRCLTGSLFTWSLTIPLRDSGLPHFPPGYPPPYAPLGTVRSHRRVIQMSHQSWACGVVVGCWSWAFVTRDNLVI